MKKKKPASKVQAQVLGSRFFIWGGVLLLVLIVFALGKAALRKHDIQTEIDGLAESIESLETENTELDGLIDYFQTTDFQEREAREKLGLKQPGETVVAIASNDLEDTPVFLSEDEETEDAEASNPRKWWNYFFNVGI